MSPARKEKLEACRWLRRAKVVADLCESLRSGRDPYPRVSARLNRIKASPKLPPKRRDELDLLEHILQVLDVGRMHRQ